MTSEQRTPNKVISRMQIAVARDRERVDSVVAEILPACRSTVTRDGFAVCCIRRDAHRLHTDRHGRTWE